MTADLKADAGRLRVLHHACEPLVLPNVWDAASVKIVAEAGFPVVTTASAAISAMLGYPDGEGAPWQEMFAAAGRVARAIPVPVTVDAEAGYGMEPQEKPASWSVATISGWKRWWTQWRWPRRVS